MSGIQPLRRWLAGDELAAVGPLVTGNWGLVGRRGRRFLSHHVGNSASLPQYCFRISKANSGVFIQWSRVQTTEQRPQDGVSTSELLMPVPVSENRNLAVVFSGMDVLQTYTSLVMRQVKPHAVLPPPSARGQKLPRLVRASEPTYQRLLAASRILGCTLGEAADRGLAALEREIGREFNQGDKAA